MVVNRGKGGRAEESSGSEPDCGFMVTVTDGKPEIHVRARAIFPSDRAALASGYAMVTFRGAGGIWMKLEDAQHCIRGHRDVDDLILAELGFAKASILKQFAAGVRSGSAFGMEQQV